MPGPLIDAATLQSKLDDPNLAILDCRFDLMQPAAGRRQWLQGHIPGAAYADLDQDLAGPVTTASGRHPLPDVANFAEKIGGLGVGNDCDVVVYDAGNGAIAARAWWLLRWLGHQRVRLLERGIAGWYEEGRELATGDQDTRSREFAAKPCDEMVLDTDDIVAAGDDVAALRLVDARDPARFRGEIEPIDTVAGHIPGALNLPFTALQDANGRFRNSFELQALWSALLGDDRDADWAVMCGSGVTACHLALAAELAGYARPALYVGSWSEWIRDPGRAVASGP